MAIFNLYTVRHKKLHPTYWYNDQTSSSDLKQRLIETWFGIQQNVIDQAIDHQRVCLNACFKAKEKQVPSKSASKMAVFLRKGLIKCNVCNICYPCDAMLARVIVIAKCLSVRPSVCLSVTRRYCVKTKKASVMISSPSGSPKTLVFWRQISSPNSKGFPRTGASKKGGERKFSDFLALSVNISKTVADTAKVTISH